MIVCLLLRTDFSRLCQLSRQAKEFQRRRPTITLAPRFPSFVSQNSICTRPPPPSGEGNVKRGGGARTGANETLSGGGEAGCRFLLPVGGVQARGEQCGNKLELAQTKWQLEPSDVFAWGTIDKSPSHIVYPWGSCISPLEGRFFQPAFARDQHSNQALPASFRLEASMNAEEGKCNNQFSKGHGRQILDKAACWLHRTT